MFWVLFEKVVEDGEEGEADHDAGAPRGPGGLAVGEGVADGSEGEGGTEDGFVLQQKMVSERKEMKGEGAHEGRSEFYPRGGDGETRGADA